MPKNKRTLILSERLQELIEIKQDEDITLSQTQQAKQMGIPHQNFAKYVNDEAECSISTICKIAEYYGVSTDYLLGRTDIKSTDTTMQSVCEYTGLSEKAIQLVVEHKNCQSPEFLVPCVYAPDIVLSFLNRLLSQRAFYLTISSLVSTARHIAICDFLVSDNDKSHAMANLNSRFSEIFMNDFDVDYVVDYEKKKIYEQFQQLIDTMLDSYNVEEDDFLKRDIEHFADENYCPF